MKPQIKKQIVSLIEYHKKYCENFIHLRSLNKKGRWIAFYGDADSFDNIKSVDDLISQQQRDKLIKQHANKTAIEIEKLLK